MGAIRKKISKYKPSAFQGRLDLSPVAAMSFKAEHSVERTMIRVLLFVLVAIVCAYLYLVTASVLNVMARREALVEIGGIQGAISTLEQRYFALSQELTPQMGGSLGLAPVGETSYVYRPGSIGAATIARNEI